MDDIDCLTNIIVQLLQLELYHSKYNNKWRLPKLMQLYQHIPIFHKLLSSKNMLSIFNSMEAFRHPVISFPDFVFKYQFRHNNSSLLLSHDSIVRCAIDNCELKVLEEYYNTTTDYIKIMNSGNNKLIEHFRNKTTKRGMFVPTIGFEKLDKTYIIDLINERKCNIPHRITNTWIYNSAFNVIRAITMVNELKDKGVIKRIWTILIRNIRIFDKGDILEKIIDNGAHSINRFQHAKTFLKSGYSIALLGYKLGKLSIDDIFKFIISPHIHWKYSRYDNITLLMLLIELDNKFSEEQYYEIAKMIYMKHDPSDDYEAMLLI